jgi:D-alanyl-D-alanine dipeptidase
MPHSTGRSVDVALWDLNQNKEIYLRDSKDGTDALFINFYRNRSDSEGKKFQELQDNLINLMQDKGFRLGTKNEYFHFNFEPNQPRNY